MIYVQGQRIPIPASCRLVNPCDYTDSIKLDVKNSNAGFLHTGNLQNRACLGERKSTSICMCMIQLNFDIFNRIDIR